MKTINRIQYFLFAIILIGMFASFAQNEYSSMLLIYPYLFIGILFLIEIFLSVKEISENQPRAFFLFFERLGFGLFFCGIFFKSMHWFGANFVFIAGALIILVLYAGQGIKKLSLYTGERIKSNLIIFILAFITCLAILAYSFNLQHWTAAASLILVSGVISFIFLVLIVANIKMREDNERISLRRFLYQLKSRLVLAYVFFSFWTVYFTLVSIGAAPKLYSLENPPALERLYQEQNPAAEIYRKNYQQFLDNRKASKSVMVNKGNSK